MIWDKFKDHFDESWEPVVRPFIESNDCDELYAYLKQRGRERRKIAPLPALTYRCFKETPLHKMKTVLMGMSPYHTMRGTSTIVADGLLMGCSVTERLQPSLEKFYDGIEKDMYNGLNLHYEKTPDVTYLAKQGVLMFNASLTTEINKPGSHLKVWESFTKHILEFGIGPSNVPVVFLGKEAAKFKRWLSPMQWSFIVSHPASAAYNHTDWDTEGVFTKVNRLLVEDKKHAIKWLKLSDQEEYEEDFTKPPF